MKRLALLLFLVLVSGCARSVPQPVVELQNTLEALCELYEENRELVVKTRAFVILHWEETPNEIKDDLRRINEALPALDQRGRDICEVARATAPLIADARNRDELAAALIRLIGVGLQLKAQGVI